MELERMGVLRMSEQGLFYAFGGVVLGAAGLFWAVWGDRGDVTYTAVEGISVFAVVYLIAQSAERVTELVVSGLSLIPNSPEAQKKTALHELRKADSTLNGNPDVADIATAAEAKTDAKKEADEARKDIAFLAGGLSVLLCALGVTMLNYGLLEHIGAEGVDGKVDRVLTTLAAAGGTKTLHELIGRFQKAKENAEE